ncbi:MAG: FAD-binding protein [Bacteroidetes bacterium]|nr:FAD-binding protein [Bacteroidota bacterium]
MRKIIEIAVSPGQAAGEKSIRAAVARSLGIQQDELSHVRLIKRSVDSRSRRVLIRLRLEAVLHEDGPYETAIRKSYLNVAGKTRVVIAGAGPAGLFAALRMIELGLKPVILERGKDVHNRKTDIALLNRKQLVDPDSNYCFGEGGAGTFSDGKLYTRSNKRGDAGRIMDTLVYHGADPDIRVDAHPHIGSDKLPAIVENIRNTILQSGGEIHFGSRVSRLVIREGRLKAFADQNGNLTEGKAFILATGHSARDIPSLFLENDLPLEFKPFALGVRVEHPQSLIDSIQYHSKTRNPFLPAASYSLVHQASGRGVFSFCMCPGGIIVPSATEDGQVVVNGMSNSRRNSPFANSGIVVTIDAADLKKYSSHGVLKGLKFQEEIEKISYLAGGSCQRAPAQRLTDFIREKISDGLPDTSYHPGITNYPVHQLFPGFITQRLQEAFLAFDRKMKGFLTSEAVVLAAESRTSSPVRIPRDPQTMAYIAIENLYPCGEGAGYAGGIVSSAMDGEAVAEAIAGKLL